MASCEDDDYSLLGDGDEAHQAAASLAAAAAAAIASEKGRREKRKDRPPSHSHSHDDLDGEALSSSPSPSPYSIASRSVKKQLLQLHEDKEKDKDKERGEFRKDREEWSDGAIEALLDSYTHRFELLNRGNLRGRDWEDVAAAVSHNCGGDRDGKGKTVEQCKNKIDNLKKRYKVECHRLSTGGLSVSHWPWFAKLDLIVSANSNSEIMTGHGKGTRTLIPRIIFIKKEVKWLFTLRRKQFPVRVCYAMTINKSQGQTLENIGIYLPNPVFSHGQLYVALSRASNKEGIKILIANPDGRNNSFTRNIVFKEVFKHLGIAA